MQHAKNNRAETARASRRAEILIEALPWIKNVTGKTVVIKYGGAAMVDTQLRDSVMADIMLLKLVGLNPIIVHGGGNDISSLCDRLGMPVEFKNGMRVTSPETMEVVRMVLVGKVNAELVSALNCHGHIAVGVSGVDGGIIKASCLDPELGRVGKVDEIDTTLLMDLIADDYIPVIASVAVGDDGGTYNVNADVVAGEIAAAIGAQKVIFLTDVDGLYEDFSNKESLISRLSLTEAQELIGSGTLAKGMIPKIGACVTALSAGVTAAHILNGTSPHSLLLEVFTDEGVGTMVTRDAARTDYEEFPMTSLATKINAANDEDR